MSTTTDHATDWRVCKFPAMPAELLNQRDITDATLSASDSGSIYWDKPAPRSFVRGAVYDASGRLCQDSQRMGGVNADLVISVNPPMLSRREMDEAAQDKLTGHWLYAGSWMHGFGHFLVETLPALWPMFQGGPDFDGICAHRFNSARTHEWQSEIIGLLTDKPVKVITDAPATVERLTIGARPYHYQRHISPVADLAWTAVSDAVGGETGAPVYLSRTMFHQAQATRSPREFTNSAAVDQAFRDHGFRVLYPETMTVTEQIRAARTAPILAGQAGSALHLSVFQRPGGRVIEVGDARTGDNLVATQQAISAVKEQPIAQIPYRGDDRGNVDLAELRRALDRLS